MREADQARDAWIPNTAFDVADIGRVKFGEFAKCLLGKLFFLAMGSNISSQSNERGSGDRHAPLKMATSTISL